MSLNREGGDQKSRLLESWRQSAQKKRAEKIYRGISSNLCLNIEVFMDGVKIHEAEQFSERTGLEIIGFLPAGGKRPHDTERNE